MYIRKWMIAATIGMTAIAVSFTYTPSAFAQDNYLSQSILKQGLKGDQVTNLQLQLKNLKYFSVDATGYYGSITKDAVMRFQKDMGLSADGIAGSKTIEAIQNTNTEKNKIIRLQLQLKNLGYFNVEATGHFGSITKQAVMNFQRDNGLVADGVVGSKTEAALQRAIPKVSRGSSQSLLVPWFDQAENIFKKGSIAIVTDINTGITFSIKRICGYNHADVETLTAEDTKKLLKIYGGQWSWGRRAIIVNVNGREMAASMAAMPHAGRDDEPYGKVIDNRSGGYGRGQNLDGVKNNNMSGVIDIHFYKSKTHGTNSIDNKHQKMVLKASRSR